MQSKPRGLGRVAWAYSWQLPSILLGQAAKYLFPRRTTWPLATSNSHESCTAACEALLTRSRPLSDRPGIAHRISAIIEVQSDSESNSGGGRRSSLAGVASASTTLRR